MRLSANLNRLFECEINNEHLEKTGQSRDGSSAPGGINPATLGSALDSVNQGLDLDAVNMDVVAQELQSLLDEHGEDAEVRGFMDGAEEEEDDLDVDE